MKVTPILAGVVGVAQLSTLGYIYHPNSGIDIGLTGTVGPYMLWSIPLGAILGTSLGWLLMCSRGQSSGWREWGKSCLVAAMIGVFVAPNSPMCLGLARQTTEQYLEEWQILCGLSWSGTVVAAVIERLCFHQPKPKDGP